MADKDNRNAKPFVTPIDSAAVRNPEVEDLYHRLEPTLRRPKPGPEAVAAAMEAAQRLAAEADAEDAASDTSQDLAADAASVVCAVCGYHNRQGTKFCGICGVPATPQPEPEDERRAAGPISLPASAPGAARETHHYHHHYHHHYFPGAQEAPYLRAAAEPVREEKFRPNAAVRGDMSRAEAAVRRVTQEWVLACNTKHLDDLLDLYSPDAMVLRSNCQPIRGAAAVREFFFGALDAGLGEVELEPLRVDVAGDMAYEAGRCKALIPSSTGKRREERGKYLWVCARQSNGEWKVAADCWSSDLTLGALEADVPATSPVRTSQPRKNL